LILADILEIVTPGLIVSELFLLCLGPLSIKKKNKQIKTFIVNVRECRERNAPL
jgi:hypothetical protein